MLIDWISASLTREQIGESKWVHLEGLTDRIIRMCPKTGEVRYQSAAWDQIRSDSHQVMVQVSGSHLRMQGSPARVCGDGDTVFGSGPSRVLDLVGCVERMARFVGSIAGVDLGIHPMSWRVSRVDVTGNLALGDAAEVRQALSILRDCEGGRYRVSQQSGDTVYWGGKSGHRRGKAYAKGPHLSHLRSQPTYTGRDYTGTEITSAGRLLRLELTLGRKFWQQKDEPWFETTGGELAELWENYWGQMIGDADMKTESDVKQRIFEQAKTEGQGRAAYGMWLLIQSEGWEKAREATARTTWYRNLKILRAAGLGDADISAGRVVQLRRKVLDAQLVESWAELEAA